MSQQMRFRSFKRGTLCLCRSKGCKITSFQSWRSEKNPAARPTSHHTSAARIWFPDDRIILKLWQLVTLKPVDIKRPTVPLWKDLNLLLNLNLLFFFYHLVMIVRMKMDIISQKSIWPHGIGRKWAFSWLSLYLSYLLAWQKSCFTSYTGYPRESPNHGRYYQNSKFKLHYANLISERLLNKPM